MNRPNILWYCTDQQRFDTIGALGNEFVLLSGSDLYAESFKLPYGHVPERARC